MQQKMTLDAVEDLARDTLIAAGATKSAASSVARSTRLAEPVSDTHLTLPTITSV